ncbi:MAG: tRNA pseudouridine(55) synthase TruB [Myxococcales bacterium]|nr:tRNA pseudouridine(55) synthase TruB [Myxococcales bacterium]
MSRRRKAGEAIDGVLLVDKPQGPTSFTVVKRVQRALGAQRAGHTGTLDPMATGLLVICLGQATRLVPYLMAATKRYRGTVRLGIATTTLDAEGDVVREDAPEQVAQVDADAFAAALPGFTGLIEQRPPAFSAIKVDGQRLHALARAGEEVEAPLRTVTIESLRLVGAAPPDFEIDVTCSKGTYIRSLAADLAGALGLAGHLVALRRLGSAPFSVDDGLSLDAIEADPAAALARLLRPADAVAFLPGVALTPAEVDHLRHGRRCAFPSAPPGVARALDAEGRLVALVEARGSEPADIIRVFGGGGSRAD